MASFLEAATGGLAGRLVLDLGCGAGGITRVLARDSGSAVGLDNASENVEAAKLALESDAGCPACFVQGDALRLPFRDEAFDVVLMSGLLEWMGFAMPNHPPQVAQLATLREVRRVLAPGGQLFVGIENRWFPRFLWRSPHQDLLLALLWPAWLSWALPRWFYGQKVHERLYGPRALARLFRQAGFADTDTFLPVFSYQFPRSVVHSADRAELARAVDEAENPPTDDFEVVATGGRRGRLWFRLILALRVQAWLAPCLIVTGRRAP